MTRYRALFLLLGFSLLGALVYVTGARQILAYLSAIGWRFTLVLGVALCWQVGNTVAWGLAFRRGVTGLRFRDLFVAKLGGDAINNITPLLNLGGEFVKPYLIHRHAPLPAGFASIVITKTVQAVTGVLYALIGVGLALFFLRLPFSLWATAAGIVCAGGGVLLWLFVQQQRNPFSALLNALSRAGVRAGLAEARRHGVEEMEAQISAYYREERGRLALSVSIQFLSWVFGVVETWLIVRLLGAPISFGTAFFLTTLSSVINTAFFFVPAGVGIQEGGQVFLFSLLGLPLSMGMAVGLVKRTRKLCYVLAGLLAISGWLFRQSRKDVQEALGGGEGCRAQDTV